MNIEAALKNLDNPIETLEQDLLQRGGFAENFCQILAAASPNESNVFALNGEWGSGKTSVKNLIKNELVKSGEKAPLVVEFNPWAFSGQDQVLEAFFSEIGKIIGRDSDGKAVAEGFRKLGAYLSFGSKTVKTLHIGMDLFGIPGSKIVGLVGEQMESGSKDAKEYGGQIENISKVSLEEVQKELKEGLTKFNRSLLIILDDLDRLTPGQLLLVFQIVKQNANLPRVNFLLLMDPKTIGVRLEKMNLGAEFIEKIVQYELTLPHIPDEELKLILKEGFKFVMGKCAEQIDWNRWEEAWINGCQNLFTNLRRIKRFLHTLKFHVTVFSNDDVLEVDPVDLFLIETVRKFSPEMHAEIPKRLQPVIFHDPLVFALWSMNNKQGQFGEERLNSLLELAPQNIKPEIRHILGKMFPQFEGHSRTSGEDDWVANARICDNLFFNSYFRLAIPRQQLTQQEIKNLFDSANDRIRLRIELKNLCDKVGLHSVLHRIQCHSKK